LESREHDLKLRRQFSVQIEWRWRAPRTFPLASGESQEDGREVSAS
jgi:hypothetical protein